MIQWHMGNWPFQKAPTFVGEIQRGGCEISSIVALSSRTLSHLVVCTRIASDQTRISVNINPADGTIGTSMYI